MIEDTHTIQNTGLVRENAHPSGQERKPIAQAANKEADPTNAQTDIDPQEVNYQPPEHEIALRAYELYLQRDKQPGHESEDWEQARRELIEARK